MGVAAHRRALIALVLGASVAWCAREASADDKKTLSGTWSASALSEKWTTTDWSDTCGPKPSPQGAPGGSVTIAEQGGELSISGAGRSFSTSQCWEQMPGLARSSHSAGSRGWTTRCTSAAGDPRHATVVTNISATDDTIVLAETGTYEFFLEGAKCHASVSRGRSFKIVQRAGEEAAPSATPQPTAKPTPPPTPPPTSEPSSGCSEPGMPTRLEVRPQKKLLRPGESFTVSALVTDDKGCHVGAHPTFKIEGDPSGKVTAEPDGRITAPNDATEASLFVVVDLGGKQIKVSVEIVASDRYDALLKERGLNPSGEDDRAATVEIASGLGGSQSISEDAGKKRKQVFIGVVGGVAAFLALCGFILVRRGRRPAPIDDGRDLTPAEPAAVALFESDPNQMMRCPRCEELFAPSTGFCPNDGAALILSGVASLPPPSSGERPVSTRSARPKAKIDKICPTCGDRFDGEAVFCGKDGTSLVPIN